MAEKSPYDLRVLLRKGVTLTPALLDTLNVVLEKKCVSAEEVSEITKRPKNIESKYLSELNSKGLIGKVRIGRKIYYFEIYEGIKYAKRVLGEKATAEEIAFLLHLPLDVVKMCLEGS